MPNQEAHESLAEKLNNCTLGPLNSAPQPRPGAKRAAKEHHHGSSTQAKRKKPLVANYLTSSRIKKTNKSSKKNSKRRPRKRKLKIEPKFKNPWEATKLSAKRMKTNSNTNNANQNNNNKQSKLLSQTSSQSTEMDDMSQSPSFDFTSFASSNPTRTTKFESTTPTSHTDDGLLLFSTQDNNDIVDYNFKLTLPSQTSRNQLTDKPNRRTSNGAGFLFTQTQETGVSMNDGFTTPLLKKQDSSMEDCASPSPPCVCSTPTLPNPARNGHKPPLLRHAMTPKKRKSLLTIETAETTQEIFKNPFLENQTKPKKGKRRSLINNSVETKSAKEFILMKTIGSGKFGSVSMVVNKIDGCTYALKKILMSSKSSRARAIAVREAQVLAALSSQKLGGCPYILKYYSSWFEDVMLVIQTEYCALGNVKEQWKSKNINRIDIWNLLLQIAEALNYMHTMGIVHLDVKPDNILVHENGGFRLADFGLATLISTECDRSKLPVTEGDRRYLAWEVLQEDYSQLDKSDLYSLGITAYELLSGEELPHNGLEWQRLRHGQFDRSFECHEYFSGLIIKMMCPDVSQRINSSSLLSELRSLNDSFMDQEN